MIQALALYCVDIIGIYISRDDFKDDEDNLKRPEAEWILARNCLTDGSDTHQKRFIYHW